MMHRELLRDHRFCLLVPLADRFIAVHVITQWFAGPFGAAAVDSDSGRLDNLEVLPRRVVVVLDPQALPRAERVPAVLPVELVRHTELGRAVAQLVSL